MNPIPTYCIVSVQNDDYNTTGERLQGVVAPACSELLSCVYSTHCNVFELLHNMSIYTNIIVVQGSGRNRGDGRLASVILAAVNSTCMLYGFQKIFTTKCGITMFRPGA